MSEPEVPHRNANGESLGLVPRDGLDGDERSGRRNFRRDERFHSGFRFEIEGARPRRDRTVGKVYVVSAEEVGRVVSEGGHENLGTVAVDDLVADGDDEERRNLDRRSRGEKVVFFHGTRGYSEMDRSNALRRRSIRKPTVTNRTPQKMKKSALSIMSKNQSKYFAKTKTVTAASETFTVNESFLLTPANIPAMAKATKYALVKARNANWETSSERLESAYQKREDSATNGTTDNTAPSATKCATGSSDEKERSRPLASFAT